MASDEHLNEEFEGQTLSTKMSSSENLNHPGEETPVPAEMPFDEDLNDQDELQHFSSRHLKSSENLNEQPDIQTRSVEMAFEEKLKVHPASSENMNEHLEVQSTLVKMASTGNLIDKSDVRSFANRTSAEHANDQCQSKTVSAKTVSTENLNEHLDGRSFGTKMVSSPQNVKDKSDIQPVYTKMESSKNLHDHRGLKSVSTEIAMTENLNEEHELQQVSPEMASTEELNEHRELRSYSPNIVSTGNLDEHFEGRSLSAKMPSSENVSSQNELHSLSTKMASSETLTGHLEAPVSLRKGRLSVEFALDSEEEEQAYEDYLRKLRKERNLKKRKTLPSLLPSDFRLSPTRRGSATPNSPSPGRKTPSSRRSSAASERRSQSRATLFSQSPDPPGSRAASASTNRITRRFLYSLAVISMNSRRSSSSGATQRAAWKDAASRASRSSSLGIGMGMGAVAGMMTLKRRAFLKLRLSKSQMMWRKIKVWVRIIYVLKKLLDKYAPQAMTDPASPFYAHKGATLEDPTAGIDKDHYMFFDPSHFKANRQMRMSQEAKRILTKAPEDRTPEEIHFAMIGLRGLPIIAEYPVRMQRNLAQYGRFECFEAKRVIVKQGRKPEGFYFVLYGSVIVAVKNDITGFAKIVCDINRGESFGELAIINKGTRNSSVLTKTYTELLNISDTVYEQIFMIGQSRNINDPDQYEFLSSMPFLRGWPVKKIFNNPDPTNVTFGYFTRKSVLVKDSNFSDWLIVVKSGSVTVLKKLVRTKPTVNKRTGQFSDPSITTNFFTFLTSDTDYHRWLSNHNVTLPPPLTTSDLSSDGEDEKEEDEEEIKDEDENGDDLEVGENNGDGTDDDWQPGAVVTTKLRPLTSVGGTAHAISSIRKTQSAFGSRAPAAFRKRSSIRRPKIKFAPETQEFELTDEVKFAATKRTFLDDLDAGYRARAHILTEADMNPQFVYVQTLTKGDVFGLAPLVFPDQPSLCLISNGAECLMIKKKFYLDNCPPELSQRLKVEVSPYPSEKKLQQDLVNRVNWDVYKSAITRQVYQHSRVTVTPL